MVPFRRQLKLTKMSHKASWSPNRCVLLRMSHYPSLEGKADDIWDFCCATLSPNAAATKRSTKMSSSYRRYNLWNAIGRHNLKKKQKEKSKNSSKVSASINGLNRIQKHCAYHTVSTTSCREIQLVLIQIFVAQFVATLCNKVWHTCNFCNKSLVCKFHRRGPVEMGRMSDYDIRPKPKVWAGSPNECRTFGRMLCARMKQRLSLVSALNG